jgi:hypothetical protein
MSGGQNMIAAQAGRYERYCELRDAGTTDKAALAIRLGVTPRTIELYERSYRRLRGLPLFQPRPDYFSK